MKQALLLKITDVVRAIEQDPNRDRIEKLMAFSYYRIWNRQPQALKELDLQHLIFQILGRYPTPEELQAQLHYLAGTLNKTAEYTLVANTILGYLAPLYADQQPSPDPTLCLDFASVALQLQQDPDALRIKKLLVCACGHPWQNDVAVLDTIAIENVVAEMRHIAPTRSALKTTLDSVVATLNRAQAYVAIAERVVHAFLPLYEDGSPTSSSHDCTELLDAGVNSPEMTDLTIAPSVVEPSQSASQSSAREAPPLAIAPAKPTSNRALTLSVLAKALPRVELDMADLYDLRLEIIKYTCPLRAKVLLFSTLRQHTNWSGHDYSLLKATDLSALLTEMFQTYKQREQLCLSLQTVAAQLTPASDYLQACGAIVRAISPWYSALSFSPETTGREDQTVADPSAVYTDRTDVQFSQNAITGMVAQETHINGGALYESA